MPIHYINTTNVVHLIHVKYKCSFISCNMYSQHSPSQPLMYKHYAGSDKTDDLPTYRSLIHSSRTHASNDVMVTLTIDVVFYPSNLSYKFIQLSYDLMDPSSYLVYRTACDSMKLLSLNDICPCPCPVSVSYVYKFYFFIKNAISILIQSNIPSSFDGFLEPDLSLYLARCSQPIMLVAYIWAVHALAGQI